MFKYISVEEQLIKEKKKNAQLRAENAELAANVDYLAMMCDVELDEDKDAEVTSDE
jgi:hypothetical protein